MISYEGLDRDYEENREEYIKIFDEVMSRSNYENNEEFENNFSEYIDREYCVSVSNATDGLFFSLLANGIGPGDEVLVTDFSWISSASCVSMTGAIPVFCDIDIESYHMNIESIKRMYSPRVKAIVYPHLFGNMTDTLEVEKFCKENNIVFIEDAAQSIGSSLNGRRAGTIGECSVFSFNTNKVVPGINGGGIICTDNKKIADTLKKLRRHGKDSDFSILGYNSRMYVLNAKIIEFRLKNLEKNKQKRQRIARIYSTEFADLPVDTQIQHVGLDHNYHKYVIRLQDKDTRKKVKDALSASIHYEKPISDNAMFCDTIYRKDNCANAKIATDTVVSLPIHAWLKIDEITQIIETVKKVLE